MPFARAGFNGRNYDTGIRAWTRHVDGKRFAPAELRRLDKGDYLWVGKNFAAWGDQVVIGTVPGFELAFEHQFGLPESIIPVNGKHTGPVRLRLPYPVSANRYWRHFGYNPRSGGKARAVTFVSEDGKAFKEECQWLARAAGVRSPLAGTLELHVRLIPENRVCMDLDNALKVVIDALKGIVYEDDGQIYRIVAERGDADPAGKHLEVEVYHYTVPMALERAA